MARQKSVTMLIRYGFFQGYAPKQGQNSNAKVNHICLSAVKTVKIQENLLRPAISADLIRRIR